MAELLLVHTGHNGYGIVDLQTGAIVSHLKGCSGRKYSSSFVGGPSNASTSTGLGVKTTYYAVADASRAFVHFFRFDKPESPCLSHAVPEKLPAICFTPCGSLCVAGGETGNCYVWEVSTGALLRCWRGHYKSVTSISMSPDGGYLFTSGSDAAVFCYSMAHVLDARGARRNEDPHALQRWSSHRAPVMAMALMCMASSELLLLTGSSDRVVHVWHPTCGSPIATYLLPAEIRHLATNPTSMEAYTCCGDGSIYVLNLGALVDPSKAMFRLGAASPVDIASTVPAVFRGHSGPVDCCTPNADGSILASCGIDGIRIWDCQSRETTKRLPSLGDVIVAVSMFRDDVRATYRKTTSQHRVPTSLSSTIYGIPHPSRIPLPVSKAFQRTWTNVVRPPSVVLPSREPAFYRALASYCGEALSVLGRGKETMTSEMEVRSLDRLIEDADCIEAHALGRTIVAMKRDRQRFSEAMYDVFDTLCHCPTLTQPHQEQEGSGEDGDAFYACHLPLTPIRPTQVSSLPSFFHCENSHSPTIPTQSRRLFRYIDRSFVRSTLPPEGQQQSTRHSHVPHSVTDRGREMVVSSKQPVSQDQHIMDLELAYGNEVDAAMSDLESICTLGTTTSSDDPWESEQDESLGRSNASQESDSPSGVDNQATTTMDSNVESERVIGRKSQRGACPKRTESSVGSEERWRKKKRGIIGEHHVCQRKESSLDLSLPSSSSSETGFSAQEGTNKSVSIRSGRSPCAVGQYRSRDAEGQEANSDDGKIVQSRAQTTILQRPGVNIKNQHSAGPQQDAHGRIKRRKLVVEDLGPNHPRPSQALESGSVVDASEPDGTTARANALNGLVTSLSFLKDEESGKRSDGIGILEPHDEGRAGIPRDNSGLLGRRSSKLAVKHSGDRSSDQRRGKRSSTSPTIHPVHKSTVPEFTPPTHAPSSTDITSVSIHHSSCEVGIPSPHIVHRPHASSTSCVVHHHDVLSQPVSTRILPQLDGSFHHSASTARSYSPNGTLSSRSFTISSSLYPLSRRLHRSQRYSRVVRCQAQQQKL